ncbi:hypothetical protein ACH0BF_02165 [Pseudobacillus sp. 179-B 2D1 NHS]|uniref:hypothetical protein n=1 Tax=Pseudobacillus sp. 179-B 2D1 NHS TaxID=3374292 RepID=UPI0038792E4E
MEQLFTIKRKVVAINELNREITTLQDAGTVEGVLDLLTGSTVFKYARMQEESTHILICDVVDVKENDILINQYSNKKYEVTYVDNPLNMNDHLEIELKFIPQSEEGK